MCEIENIYRGELKFLVIFDRIEFLSSNIALAKTIKEPLKNEGLTLNSDEL